VRRVAAYLFDLTVTTPVVLGAWFVAEIATQKEINYGAFFLFFFPIFISLFEYIYGGKTPGKFVMRLTTISATGELLPLVTYYKRSVIITYLAPVSFVAIEIIYGVFLGVSLHNLSFYYSSCIYFAFIAVPAMFSLGSQSGHDYVCNTAVVSDSKARMRQFKEKYANISAVLLVAILTGGIYFVDGNRGRLLDAAKERGYEEEIAEFQIAMTGVVPDTYIIERNVDDLFRYYDDLQGFIGMRDLMELDRKIGIQTPSALTFTADEGTYIPAYRVFVTLSGLINGRFKETVTRNLLEHSMNVIGSEMCVVEFVYRDDVVRALYFVVKDTKIGVYAGALSGSAYGCSMVLTPKDSGYINISMSELPLFMIK
jgi:uncharacterized RDD family membrane protein YckC